MRFTWKKMRYALYGLGALLGIFAAIAFFSGQVIYDKTITVCERPGSACQDTPLPLGPVSLQKKGHIYKLSIESPTINHGSWLDIQIALLNNNSDPVALLVDDFWVEDWYEGGESGTEIKNTTDYLFTLTDPDQYFIDFEFDPSDQYGREDLANHELRVRVYEDIILSRYFIIASGLIFIMTYLIDQIIRYDRKLARRMGHQVPHD